MKVVYLLRKPTTEPTVAKNALRWGAGALNIDAGRIAAPRETIATHSRSPEASAKENRPVYGEYGPLTTHQTEGQRLGRWPANLILQHRPACAPSQRCAPECPVAALDQQSGVLSSNSGKPFNRSGRATGAAAIVPGKVDGVSFYGDTGGASRFFRQVHPGAP